MHTTELSTDLPEEVLKRCSHCHQSKALDQFYRDRSKPDGFEYRCKTCKNMLHKQRYDANPEHFRAMARRSNHRRRPAMLKQKREYRLREHDKLTRASAQYYAKNQPELCQKSRVYYLTHQPEAQAYARDYHARHDSPERRAAAVLRTTQWVKTNPDKARAIGQRHRARKRDAPLNDFTAAQWESMKRQYDYRCAYCGKKPKQLTQDHITALSKGGSHTASNIVPACRSCNSKKGDRKPLCPIQPVLCLAV